MLQKAKILHLPYNDHLVFSFLKKIFRTKEITPLKWTRNLSSKYKTRVVRITFALGPTRAKKNPQIYLSQGWDPCQQKTIFNHGQGRYQIELNKC